MDWGEAEEEEAVVEARSFGKEPREGDFGELKDAALRGREEGQGVEVSLEREWIILEGVSQVATGAGAPGHVTSCGGVRGRHLGVCRRHPLFALRIL